MQLQLAMHSSPRFSTWLWFNDWKLLIDAGDGVTQQLGYKIRKIDTFLMTHAHRDHVGGLIQVVNQRGEAGSFLLGHPVGGRAWGQMEHFTRSFNPGSSNAAMWKALEEGDWIESGVEGRLMRSFRTRHYADDDLRAAPRSLGFHLIWRKMKVKPEYQSLTQAELDKIRLEIGREGITAPVDEKWVTVSGDGEPLSAGEVAGTQLLVHEATFLSPDDYDAEEAGEDVGHVHSTLWQALSLAREAGVPNVLLYHISTRYSDAEIRDAVRAVAGEIKLEAKVWAALPRRVYFDVFREKPLFGS
ncbi:MAG: MBL fold metallo-hydrolase [Armatimonadetes bacterium]|nr:MBL fold metallo-hydrolase [Armatimonadota bacterium]